MSEENTDNATNAENKSLTPEELLNQVNESIVNSTAAVSYKVGSRSVTRSSVSELKRLRADLMQEIAANNADNSLMAGVSVAVFDGR